MGGIQSYPRVYFELLLAGFFLVLAMGLCTSFLPILAWELDPTGLLVGSVTSAWFLARVFMEMPSGFLSDRVGKRRLIVLGLVLSIAGANICAISRSIHQLILGRALWGLGCAFYFTVDISLIVDLFERTERGTAVGTFQSIEFIGTFIGAPLGALMAGVFGYYSTFYAAALMTLFSFLIIFFSKSLKEVASKPRQSNIGIPAEEILKVLRNGGILVICFCVLSRMLIEQGVKSTVFQLYLNQILSYDITTIGIIITARTATFSVGTLVTGRLFNRLGGKSVLTVGLLLNGICICLYAAVSGLTGLLLLGLVEGIGSSMVSVALVILLPEFVDSSVRGTAIGLYRTFMDLGGIFGPLLFMFLYDSVGVRSPFLIGAGLLIANIAFVNSIGMYKTKTTKAVDE